MSELLTPYYQLYINGKEIDELRYSMIDTIDFEDNSSGSDLLKITISDPDLILLSDNIFVEDVCNISKEVRVICNTCHASFLM